MRSYVVFFAASIGAYAFSGMVVEYLWSDYYPAHQHYLVSAFTYLNFFSQLPVFATGLLAYRALEDRYDPRPWVISGALTFLAFIMLSLFPVRSPCLR
jgi:hypothetical protein